MSLAYEEVFEGEVIQRSAPGKRHELICGRLHAAVRASVADLRTTRLLPPRTQVPVTHSTALCPDLALVTSASGKLWLAAEIVNTEDHRQDTVVKKLIYEEIKVARLWMIDPRYDNVEIYHATLYGLALKGILAGREVLSEPLLPEFQLSVADLFAPEGVSA